MTQVRYWSYTVGLFWHKTSNYICVFNWGGTPEFPEILYTTRSVKLHKVKETQVMSTFSNTLSPIFSPLPSPGIWYCSKRTLRYFVTVKDLLFNNLYCPSESIEVINLTFHSSDVRRSRSEEGTRRNRPGRVSTSLSLSLSLSGSGEGKKNYQDHIKIYFYTILNQYFWHTKK